MLILGHTTLTSNILSEKIEFYLCPAITSFILLISFLSVIHIILLLTAAVSGFITSYSLGEVNRAYGSNCVLYGEIVLAPPKTTYNPTTTTEATTITVTATATGDELVSTTEKEDNGKKQSLPDLSDLTIDIDRSEWGTYWMCSFCQFTPLMSMIFALCWIAFFVMCGPGGAGYPSDL